MARFTGNISGKLVKSEIPFAVLHALKEWNRLRVEALRLLSERNKKLGKILCLFWTAFKENKVSNYFKHIFFPRFDYIRAIVRAHFHFKGFFLQASLQRVLTSSSLQLPTRGHTFPHNLEIICHRHIDCRVTATRHDEAKRRWTSSTSRHVSCDAPRSRQAASGSEGKPRSPNSDRKANSEPEPCKSMSDCRMLVQKSLKICIRGMTSSAEDQLPRSPGPRVN